MTIGDGIAVAACVWGVVHLARTLARAIAFRTFGRSLDTIKASVDAWQAAQPKGDT